MKLNFTTVDLARVVTPEKPNMHETYSRGPGHSTLLKSTKNPPKFDPQVTYVLDNDVVNPTQPPAASRIPSSQYNIPQAVPVCQKVTTSQGATHGVSNNRHNNTPQRQTLGMTDGGGTND